MLIKTAQLPITYKYMQINLFIMLFSFYYRNSVDSLFKTLMWEGSWPITASILTVIILIYALASNSLGTIYIIIRAKILIHVRGSADHPQSRLWLNWGSLTENTARWSNRLTQIWSQTRFSWTPSNLRQTSKPLQQGQNVWVKPFDSNILTVKGLL